MILVSSGSIISALFNRGIIQDYNTDYSADYPSVLRNNIAFATILKVLLIIVKFLHFMIELVKPLRHWFQLELLKLRL